MRSPRAYSHERTMLVGIALLMLMGTLPVFGHHLPLPGVDALGRHETLGAICLVALHLLLAPVHGVVHVLLFAGLAYAVADRVRALVHLRRGLRSLDVAPVVSGTRLFDAARACGMDPRRVRIARAPGVPAFTYGALAPRICISGALAETLSDAELRCVLAHERCHLLRRDPLRLSCLRFFGLALFWIPALRRMAADVAVEAELDADDAGAGGTPLVMASALIKAARDRTTFQLRFVVPLVRDDLLALRVRRLTGEAAVVPSRVTKRALAGASAALLVVWLSGAIVAHPLHAGEADCLRHSGWPAAHLFCTHDVVGGRPCPHGMISTAPHAH